MKGIKDSTTDENELLIYSESIVNHFYIPRLIFLDSKYFSHLSNYYTDRSDRLQYCTFLLSFMLLKPYKNKNKQKKSFGKKNIFPRPLSRIHTSLFIALLFRFSI